MRNYPPTESRSGATVVSRLLAQTISAFRAGNLAEAQRLCLDLIKKDKRNFVALHLSGVIHALQNNPEDALQSFDRALKIDPNNADIWADKGQLLTELGRHKHALPCNQKAISINPQHGNAL